MATTKESGWFSPDAATFGDRLTAAREGAALDQAGLAQRLGVHLETLREWEQDLSEPRANRLQMLAGMLNVSIRWLLTGEGDGPEGPLADVPAAPAVQAALAEMARMRASMQVMAGDLARLEKTLRAAIREDVL